MQQNFRLGVKLFNSVEEYSYYDGARSGLALSGIEQLPCVWFSAVAASSDGLFLYALFLVDEEQMRGRLRFAAEQLPPENPDTSFLARQPDFICGSADFLETVFFIVDVSNAKLPSLTAPEMIGYWSRDEWSEWSQLFDFVVK